MSVLYMMVFVEIPCCCKLYFLLPRAMQASPPRISAQVQSLSLTWYRPMTILAVCLAPAQVIRL